MPVYQRDEFSVRDSHSDLVEPAAIRSSFAIGIPVPDENRFVTQKERERQEWLNELEKQRVEQKQRREDERRRWKDDPTSDTSTTHWSQKPRFQSQPQFKLDSSRSDIPQSSDREPVNAMDSRMRSAPMAVSNQSLSDVPTTFLRGQNVPIDLETKRELEEKRRKYLEHQECLRQQIEDRERKKREEKDRQMLEDLALEQQYQRPQQPQSLAHPPPSHNPPPMTSVSQFPSHQAAPLNMQKPQPSAMAAPSKEEAEKQRQDQLVEALEAARLQAQRDRHDRWLQKLAKGNHDTSKLRAKFEEKLSPRHHPMLTSFTIPSSVEEPPKHVVVEPDFVPGLTVDLGPRVPPAGGYVDEGYVENRIITPTMYRQQQHSIAADGIGLPRKEFGTQTDLGLSRVLDRDSPTEIEYRPLQSDVARSKHVRVVSAPKSAADRKSTTTTASNRLLTEPRTAPKQQKKNHRPQWNYGAAGKQKVTTQSEKDPTFEQRRERRLERQRELLSQVAANSRHVPQRFVSRDRSTSRDREPEDRPSNTAAVEHQSRRAAANQNAPRRRPSNSSGPNRSPQRSQSRESSRSRRGSVVNQDFAVNGPPSPAVPSVKHNLDTDRSDGVPRESARSWLADRGPVPNNTDFVPFMRTSEVLDPAHADSPLPISREPTDMVKARKAYLREQNPAKYGQVMENRVNGNSNRPSSQQGRVLQHLSTLRQVLMEKQREMNSVPSPIDNGHNVLVSPVGDA